MIFQFLSSRGGSTKNDHDIDGTVCFEKQAKLSQCFGVGGGRAQAHVHRKFPTRSDLSQKTGAGKVQQITVARSG